MIGEEAQGNAGHRIVKAGSDGVYLGQQQYRTDLSCSGLLNSGFKLCQEDFVFNLGNGCFGNRWILNCERIDAF